jgi:6-phosphogluconolactonase
MIRPRRTVLHALGLLASLLPCLPANAAPVPVFFGGNVHGIHVADFDPVSGSLGAARPALALAKASFLAKSADGRFLFAVSEVADGSVHAFAIGPGHELTPLNSRPTEGAGPCAVALSPDGRLLAVANYNGGSVIIFPVGADGQLGERVHFTAHAHAARVVTKRQQKPHAHDVAWSPDGARLLVCDLGGDRVYVYARDPALDTLAPDAAQPWIELPPGTGPRHAAFSPDGRHLYIVNELDNTVALAAQDRAGGFRLLEKVSTLPPEGFAAGSSTAEIAVHPAGHTVYASNRGADTLAVFSRDAAGGRLTLRASVPVPAVPRHFTLSPDGRWLLAAGQKADLVAVFRVDPATGDLLPHGEPIAVPKPACVRL